MSKLLNYYKNIDSYILKIIKLGVKYSYYLSIFSSCILFIYTFLYNCPILYYIGFSVLKSSLFFIVGFVINGFAFNTIEKYKK